MLVAAGYEGLLAADGNRCRMVRRETNADETWPADFARA